MLRREYVDRIRLEIDEIDALQDAYQPLLSIAVSRQPDLIETAALAQVLHSFYNGVERLFVLIMKGMDRELPAGANWHRKLLDQVSEQSDEGVAAISESTKERLVEYLGFRHVVRHTYSRHLDADRIKALAKNSKDLWEHMSGEIQRFLAFRN